MVKYIILVIVLRISQMSRCFESIDYVYSQEFDAEEDLVDKEHTKALEQRISETRGIVIWQKPKEVLENVKSLDVMCTK